MAFAWVMAAAPLILLGAAILAAILIIEDLWTELKGGEGLLTLLYDKWNKFIEGFTQPHAGDNWVVATFRTIVRWIDKAVGGINDLLSGVRSFKDVINGTGGTGGPGRTLSEEEVAARFGGGASVPARTVPPSNASTSNKFDANINITAGAGADGKAIGAEVRRQLDEHWGDKMSEAHAAVSEGY